MPPLGETQLTAGLVALAERTVAGLRPHPTFGGFAMTQVQPLKTARIMTVAVLGLIVFASPAHASTVQSFPATVAIPFYGTKPSCVDMTAGMLKNNCTD